MVQRKVAGVRELAISFELLPSEALPSSFSLRSYEICRTFPSLLKSLVPGTDMAGTSDWAQALLNPSPLGLIIAILLAISIPLFLHSVVFRASGLVTLPSILLIGPSGSGKTSFLTLVSSAKVNLKPMLIISTVRTRIKRIYTHLPSSDSSRMLPPGRKHSRLR